MAKFYRPVLRDQEFLLPPDMREWLPADHLVWFLLETLEGLDLTAFDGCRRRGGVGAAGYDPAMLAALLIYAYCRGIRSSRQIEQLCSTDVAFRVICAQDVPDHCTISRFRADSKDSFAGLFAQVLLVAAEAGLGRFGTVAIDGTKLPANASMSANRSEKWLNEQVQEMLVDAERVDATEDHNAASDGVDGPDDRVPERFADRAERGRRIREALEQIHAQKRQHEQKQQKRVADGVEHQRRLEAGQRPRGKPPLMHRVGAAQIRLDRLIAAQQAKLDRHAKAVAAGVPWRGNVPTSLDENVRIGKARESLTKAIAAQRKFEQAAAVESAKPRLANTTDPQSRLLPTRKGFLQGYNTHIAVTGDQMIVAVRVDQSSVDAPSFIPMMRGAQAAAERLHDHTGNTDHVIGTVLADAGYLSDDNLTSQGPERLIALGKSYQQSKAAQENPTTGPPPAEASPKKQMDHKLRTPEGVALYKRRGATVEPGIGNLKKILNGFSRRGLDNALHELHLAAVAFNLRKIHRAATI